MGNIKNIPQLRFPEFEDLLNTTTISEISQGKLSNGVFNDPNKIGTGYYLINVKDMYTNLSIDKSSLTKLNINENEFKRNKVSFGDIFFTRSSLVKEGIAFSAVNLNNDEDITFDGHLIKLTPNQKIINPIYLAHLLKTDYIRKQLIARGKTGTMTTIGQEDIGSTKVIIPSLPEQKKIASFLTAVDDKIQQLTKKKSLLEQYKKGVMQKIFKQEIRFKDDDGKEFSEWEEKKLGDIGETYNGLIGKTKEDFGQGKPYIQYKQIFDKSRIDINKFDYVKIKYGEKQNMVAKGDVLFTTSSETSDEVGMASVLLGEVGEVYLNSFCFGYRPKSVKILFPSFSQFFFRNESIRKEIFKLAQGSTRFNMSKTQLMKLNLKIPCFEEQCKIANFLTALDNKIEQVNIQLKKTKSFKKGLLQQMFV
jgi:type I restriction enzyme S subunit